jgi:cytochrome c biogenesis protein CcdA
MVGVVVGYSASRRNSDRRRTLFSALFFIIGTIVAPMVLTAYAIGFSLPLAAVIFGVSLGKMTVKAKKAESAIRTIAGVLLVGVGFYFLATL